MERESKYRFGSGKFKPEKEPRYQEILREKERPYIIQLDLKSDNDSVVLDLETGTSGELELSLDSNSRCVSVDTFLPSPLGRRKKKVCYGENRNHQIQMFHLRKEAIKSQGKEIWIDT